MRTNQEYKNLALKNLEGKWANVAIATFIYLAITAGIGSIFDFTIFQGSSYIWSILTVPLLWGYVVFFLRLMRSEDTSLGHLFDGYKDFLRIFLAIFLMSIAVAIGFVLLIIPGIILSIGLVMTLFILKDDEQISAMDSLKQSWNMMDGHKVEFLWLNLSFIGWIILSLFTLGIGFLFLLPYMYTTFAHYYEDLKAEE
jgi:uncharacterized membrane protein